jgi:mycofactocin precursor
MEVEQESALALPEQNEGKISQEEPQVLEEIVVEELSIDGICGVY